VATYLDKAIYLIDRQIKFVEEQILTMYKAIHCPYKKKTDKLKWTGNIVDFVELGYALEAVGYVNNGKATLTELFDVLGEIFDVEVKKFSRTFIDVKNRVRGDGTYLMDDMKRALKQKIEAADAKPTRK